MSGRDERAEVTSVWQGFPSPSASGSYSLHVPSQDVLPGASHRFRLVLKCLQSMALHSSTLAWKIPWTEEPGRLQSMGSQRDIHYCATSLPLFTFMHWRRKWLPTPVFLPGESQGRGSLVGYIQSVGSQRVRRDWAHTHHYSSPQLHASSWQDAMITHKNKNSISPKRADTKSQKLPYPSLNDVIPLLMHSNLHPNIL